LAVQLRDLLTAGKGAKDDNRLKLLRTIMANPGSQAYLARRSGLSQATVSDAVRELEEKQLVLSEKKGREIVNKIPPTAGAAVGIELGFSNFAVVARRVEQSYQDVHVELRQVGAARTNEARWVPEVAEAVRDAASGIGEDEIVSIGLGVPRVVSPREGALVPPALPPWVEGEDPAQMLADELRRDGHAVRFVAPYVVLDNDANLAGYAMSIYEFPDEETLIGIKASTGVGAGIIIGGKIIRGAVGAAGEIGHIVVKRDGAICSCGGRGCLETLVGSDALVDQAKLVLGQRKLPAPHGIEELISWADDGNLICQRVLREAGKTLGFTIGNLCNILNPNVVVISGALGRAAARFALEPLEQALQDSAMQATTVGRGALKVASTAISHPAAHGALVVGLEGTTYGQPSRPSRASRGRG
jgi:predicted NBD/HSP70 family sugar kinase